MQHGGATSTGSRWVMGGKTWRAPSEAERAREAQERLVRETQRRTIQEIQHAERNIRKERELATKASRVNRQAIGLEHGMYGAGYLGTGVGGISPRIRSSSFSGIASSPLTRSYPGSPHIGGYSHGGPALIGALPGAHSSSASLQRERLRSQTRALEAEALRREQRARSLSRDRAALAIANERLLTPRMSPRLSPRLGAYGGSPAVPMHGLSHRRSWHGGYPGQVNVAHAPPLLPHGHSHSPRLFPLGTHTAGLPSVGHLPTLGSRSRSPSTGRVLVSPRIGHPPSPRVVNYNHNTYNISPHHHGHHEVLAGGLGALDDLHLGAGAVDPVLLDDYAGVPAYPPQDFVVTDAGLVEGRRILRDLGPIEGFSGLEPYSTEDDRLNVAIADLTARAQALGANAVLSVETGEDVGGQIVVRGVAALLS